MLMNSVNYQASMPGTTQNAEKRPHFPGDFELECFVDDNFVSQKVL